MPSPRVEIRDVSGIDDLSRVSELHDRVIGWTDHMVTLVQLVASLEVGAILLGAFDGETIVGFTYGFPGYREGRRILHSHALTVDPAYRQIDLGYRLKTVQRERAIALGFSDMTWTFDPLRSSNAYLNVTRLGVVAESYRTNFYGTASESAGARHIGTDRLWVNWRLASERVAERLRSDPPRAARPGLLRNAIPLIGREDTNGRGPFFRQGADSWNAPAVSIEIPDEIGLLQRETPPAAAAWRSATREAFLACFARRYRLEDFVRLPRGEGRVGVYLLEPPEQASFGESP